MSSSAAMYSWSTRDCASSWTPTDLLLAVQLVEVLSVTVLLLVGIALDAVLPVLLVTVLTLVGMALLVAALDAVLPILSLTTLPLMEQLAAASDAVMGGSPESHVGTACPQQTSLALSGDASPSSTVM